jgi:hypothetical protein
MERRNAEGFLWVFRERRGREAERMEGAKEGIRGVSKTKGAFFHYFYIYYLFISSHTRDP